MEERRLQQVELALAHAARHGDVAPCLMLSWEENDAAIDKLLADPRIGSLGVKGGHGESPENIDRPTRASGVTLTSATGACHRRMTPSISLGHGIA